MSNICWIAILDTKLNLANNWAQGHSTWNAKDSHTVGRMKVGRGIGVSTVALEGVCSPHVPTKEGCTANLQFMCLIV